MSHVTAVE